MVGDPDVPFGEYTWPTSLSRVLGLICSVSQTIGAQLRFEGAGGRPHTADAGPLEGQSLTESGSLFKVSGAAHPRARLAGQVDDCASNPGAADPQKRSSAELEGLAGRCSSTRTQAPASAGLEVQARLQGTWDGVCL